MREREKKSGREVERERQRERMERANKSGREVESEMERERGGVEREREVE
jgi:hypothetical protein